MTRYGLSRQDYLKQKRRRDDPRQTVCDFGVDQVRQIRLTNLNYYYYYYYNYYYFCAYYYFIIIRVVPNSLFGPNSRPNNLYFNRPHSTAKISPNANSYLLTGQKMQTLHHNVLNASLIFILILTNSF